MFELITDFPIRIRIFDIEITAHLIFEILAFSIAAIYYKFLNRNKISSFSTRQILNIMIGGLIGALIGSRLLAYIEHYHIFVENFSLYFLFNIKTIVGGIIGAWIGIEITKKIFNITYSSGDLFTFPLILGIIIGRIGCFLTGVSDGTVGKETDFFLAFDQGDGLMRHPTAVYEILFLIVLWVILSYMKKRYVFNKGLIFKIFMVSYCSWRLIIDFLKPIEPLFFLSAIQLSCLGVIMFYSIKFLRGKLWH